MDRLDALLRRFGARAQLFHSGALCGINDFLPEDGRGQLHLVQRGPLRVEHDGREALRVEQPTLLFYPRPLAHRFTSDATIGADMACAYVSFSGGAANPVVAALPPWVALPLADLEGAGPLLDSLFREAFGQRCGRQLIVDRLFEAVLVMILRTLIDTGVRDPGVLAGLAHPGLAKALVALHEAPSEAWPLQRLAGVAGMSRTVFAERFSALVGVSPGDYVRGWRIAVAQRLLDEGRALAQVADAVGYASETALSRAFRAQVGVSLRDWRRANRAG